MNAFAAKGIFLSLSILLLLSILAQHGCSEPREKKAVYLLVDASGPYSKQFDKVQIVLRDLLGLLTPGDSLALARIDSESFNEKDIIARMSFDLRPSMANAQKRAFIESVDQFGKNIQSSKYTDITGGFLQAIEYLNETRATQRTILIFSDLNEEIKKGQVRDFPISFNGIQVNAINIAELKTDNIESAEHQGEFHKRVESWAKRVKQGGGKWKLINNMNHPDQIINTL